MDTRIREFIEVNKIPTFILPYKDKVAKLPGWNLLEYTPNYLERMDFPKAAKDAIGGYNMACVIPEDLIVHLLFTHFKLLTEWTINLLGLTFL